MAAAVVFRTDGGPSIGGGHVMRSLALASAFTSSGSRIAFASTAETFQSISALSNAAVDKLAVSGSPADEARQIGEKYGSLRPVIVADHYRRDIEFEEKCRPFASRIVVIDDLADRKHDADVLVDSGASSSFTYQRLVPASCRILTGPAYAIVHPDFLIARESALPRRDGRPVTRILLSFGIIDQGNITALALDALEEAGFDGAIDVVLGQAAPHLSAISRRATGRTKLHVNASNMPTLIATSDMAIGAGGVTAFERCCLGLPSIIVQIADNQREVIATLVKAGAAIAADASAFLTKETLASLVRDMLGNPQGRRELAARGAALVDGLGVQRIVAAAVDGQAFDIPTK